MQVWTGMDKRLLHLSRASVEYIYSGHVDDNGQAIGPNASKFINFLGTQARPSNILLDIHEE